MNDADGRGRKRPGIERQKQIIVEAAVGAFIERGTGNVSVSEICSHARVSRHTFYRCFSDKDALLAHIYEVSVSAHIERAIERLQAGVVRHDWLAGVVDAVIDAILERAPLAQMIYSEAGIPGSAAYRVTDDAYERAATAVQQWYRSHCGREPGKALVKATMAATQWLVQDAILAGLTADAVTRAKEAARQLFEGMHLTTTNQTPADPPTKR